MATDFEDFTDIEDEETNPEAEPLANSEPARDDDGVPYCVEHHVRMKATSGGPKGSPATYYKCPVKGCKASAKRIKTTREASIPKKPLMCPSCKKAMVRDADASSAMYSILKCPSCNRKSAPLPRPEFVAVQAQRSGAARSRPNIGDR